MAHIKDYRKIHLIGVGGCSMNGIAQLLQARGYQVQGSDKAESPFTARLKELGIPVTIGQKAENIDGAELVIYSAAIKPDNPERKAAREKGIPELERSVALGQLTESYASVVGVAGCHGKTTITSMLARIAEKSALDASVHIGGFVDFLQGGTRIGKTDLFITEACEYVESFLTLHPTVVVLNNIDDDHLDYFKDIDHITDAFRKFASILPADGHFIACTDDFRVKALYAEFAGKVNGITYGLKDADFTPADIAFDAAGNASFTIMRRGEAIGRIALQIPGMHNIVNALAATATALTLGASFDDIAAGLAEFTLAKRRFEYYGERNGVKYYHDYAHHPAEVRAVLDAANRCPHGKIFVVFQCNSYTRAKTLFTKHVDCFALADEVLVPDIYPGRETDDGSVHARDMVKGILEAGSKAEYLATFENIRDYLDAHATAGDLVVTLGSGDVYLQTRKLL